MATARTTKLACGGKGPCCHIGYAHRHCEHCDVVIDLRTYNWWPYYQQIPVQTQPFRPYWPYWPYWTNTAGTAGTATLGNVLNAQPGNTGNFARALPSQTSAHVCEVK